MQLCRLLDPNMSGGMSRISLISLNAVGIYSFPTIRDTSVIEVDCFL